MSKVGVKQYTPPTALQIFVILFLHSGNTGTFFRNDLITASTDLHLSSCASVNRLSEFLNTVVDWNGVMTPLRSSCRSTDRASQDSNLLNK